jgi:hypothetical protein
VGGGSTGAGDTPLPAGASLETSNRVVFNCLGALSILAIDGEARLKALEVTHCSGGDEGQHCWQFH